jgi:hypothetical protein
MTPMFRVALLAGLAASSVPAIAAGQEASADSLHHRIDLLERRTIDLEARVRELEALFRAEPARRPPVAASTKWRDVQNWRQLRMGMTMDQVRALLGEPERVDATPSHHTGAGIIRSALRSTSTAVPERLPVGRNLNDGEYPTFTDALGEVSRRAQPAALGHDRVATAALCGSSRLRAPPLRRADLRRTIPQTPTPSATTSLHRA